MNQHFSNVRTAFMGLTADVLSKGQELDSRNGKVKELTNVCFTIDKPEKRCLFVKHRNDSIFHKVAETLWVISGRNDVEWLKAYLPQAGKWADNGTHWRAGYGPRLRNYCGSNSCVDQVAECVKLLNTDSMSRRAVMSIFDPSEDYTESLDIPCNNWIHWLIRDGKLDMNIAQRSSDIIWGFGGINSFEWSVLHQMMAYWTNTKIGSLTYFISSLHLYEHHWDMAGKIVTNQYTDQWYPITADSSFNTDFSYIDEALAELFRIERRYRLGDYTDWQTSDLLINVFINTLKTFWMVKNGVDVYTVLKHVFKINNYWYDIDLSVVEYLMRMEKYKDTIIQTAEYQSYMASSMERMMGNFSH